MYKEEKNNKIVAEGNKTEEGRLKIQKIEHLKEKSYEYKINTIFWVALSSLEVLIRYVTTDKTLPKLIPISIIPLLGFLFNKIRMDKKVNNLEEEILNPKSK